MQLSTLLLAAAATLASAGQINFYSDSNCQNYMDHRFPGSYQIQGGPAGAKSALWVSGDQKQCSRSCGPYVICGDSNCNTHQTTSIGGCVSFGSGVWGYNACSTSFC